jgi:hypothetical protein
MRSQPRADPLVSIEHFVNAKVQLIPGIQDTHTIITFKAFDRDTSANVRQNRCSASVIFWSVFFRRTGFHFA